MHFSILYSLALTSSAAFAYKPCPLLGPVFQPPTQLDQATTFQDALCNLTTTLDSTSKTGQTRYGTFTNNATSFSVGVFDATTPGGIFSYQYSSAALQNGTQGVKHVTEDSVYRIGSGSKLITVYLFLIEAGWKYWGHPITEFIPQLKSAAQNCSATSNAVDCIDWDEVTLGALASHMAGLPRDCMYNIMLRRRTHR